jgi:hypothetical protein
MCSISYYLIHNGDQARLRRMMAQFTKYELDLSKLKIMVYPGAHNITPELLRHVVQQTPSISNHREIAPEYLEARPGLVDCTYKHYLCLCDAAAAEDAVALVMEDNSQYEENVFQMLPVYLEQLRTIYNDEWDVLFNYKNVYLEEHLYKNTRIYPDVFVYPKSNKYHPMCAGSTKSARFYLIRREFAARLAEAFLPFNNGVDLWMNDLFRELGARSFWVEPANVAVEENHVSSTELHDKK